MRFFFFLEYALKNTYLLWHTTNTLFTWNKYIEDTELYKDKVYYQACSVSKGERF